MCGFAVRETYLIYLTTYLFEDISHDISRRIAMFGSGRGDCGGRWGAGRGGWGGWEGGDSWGWYWGGPRGRGGGGRFRGGRMFEQGDLKYVILQLLDEKPRHGYEIIKELEDRFGGAYSPSPGTVYPTLTMLEDLGYARASSEEGGRKT